MKKMIFFLSLPVLVVTCSIAFSEEAKSSGETALPTATVEAVPAVRMDWQPTSTVARTFVHQPPLIPHDITGFEIEALNNDNDCLNCHGVPDSGAPKPYTSHYVDRDGKVTAGISSRWFFCTQCHVGQVDAKPFVDNTFQEK